MLAQEDETWHTHRSAGRGTLREWELRSLQRMGQVLLEDQREEQLLTIKQE